MASAVYAKFGILIVFSLTLCTCKVLTKSGCLCWKLQLFYSSGRRTEEEIFATSHHKS